MKIKTSLLQSFIESIGGFISTRPLSPIKECVLFREDHGKLWLFGEGDEGGIWIKTEIPAEEGLKIAVPFVMISQTLRELKDEEIVLEFNMEKVTLEIHSSNGKYKSSCEKGDDFPTFPRRPEAFLTIDGEELANALSVAVVCCSKDELRYGMNGVRIGGTSEEPVLFSTDGFRAGKFTVNKLTGINTGVTLHRKSCERLIPFLKGKGEVQIGFDNYKFFIQADNCMMHGLIIQDAFPNCEPFFNTMDAPIKINIPIKSMKGTLKRAGVYTERATPAIIFKAEGQRGFLSSNDNIIDKNFHEEIDLEHQGGDISIAFNNTMFQEILQVLGGELLIMELTDKTKPMVLSGDNPDHKLILMPLMIERL